MTTFENGRALDNSGTIFAIKRYAIHDGPGIRTTVFFKGCPLQCRWCHNPESWRPEPEMSWRRNRCNGCGRCAAVCPAGAIIMAAGLPRTDPERCSLCGRCVASCPADAREIIGRAWTTAEVMDTIRRDVIFYDESGGGVTFSGGEPLQQPAFLRELLERCRREAIHTAVDTACHAEPRVWQTIADLADLFLCDIKHMDNQKHREGTGVDNRLILANIRHLAEQARPLWIRLPILPGFNDDADNLARVVEFVGSLGGVRRIDIIPYHRAGREKISRLSGIAGSGPGTPPSSEALEAIAGRFRTIGVPVCLGD
ncbi:MAG: glycyl-radical enzyme activating protein [Sedimentisphaerales bacterium]|nr:glycyl-radical enzyme activating protein [Sedimentisphaerales bacterium]